MVTDDAARFAETDDAILVELARQHEIAAYDELVRRYHGKLYGMIYNMTSNKEDAEDMVQEVFVTAYKSLGRFKGTSSFYTWIYRIAVNRTINFLKKRKRRMAYSLNDVDSGIETDEAFVELASRENPLRDLTLTELQEKLNAALMSLSERHRMVVVLHDVQGMPHEEIAKMMGCSSGTVRSRLFYARQELQAHLAEYVR